jgi:hypothetical protein
VFSYLCLSDYPCRCRMKPRLKLAHGLACWKCNGGSSTCAEEGSQQTLFVPMLEFVLWIESLIKVIHYPSMYVQVTNSTQYKIGRDTKTQKMIEHVVGTPKQTKVCKCNMKLSKHSRLGAHPKTKTNESMDFVQTFC